MILLQFRQNKNYSIKLLLANLTDGLLLAYSPENLSNCAKEIFQRFKTSQAIAVSVIRNN